MNQGDTLITLLKVPTNEKAMWRGREKEASRYLPIIFLFDLGSAIRAAVSFLQNTSEKHTKKKNKQTNKQRPTGDRPTATSHVCPPCHGPTKTTKVWVRTKILLTRR